MNTAQLMPGHIRLSELLDNSQILGEHLDAELAGIETDSRRLEPGDLFLACKGASFDGRDFIDEVIAKGASAVLVEQGEDWQEGARRNGVPVIPVQELAPRVGKLAAKFFNRPAAGLWLTGITGTNGKTSCCQFIAQALTSMGRKCGVSGTLGYGIYGEQGKTDDVGPGTTPDAITVQRIFREMLNQQAETMIMEVSSHGLKQGRINIHEFDMAVFTNLGRDHLDYHGSIRAYGEEKRKLFSNPHLKIAVVNLDDMFSARILNSLSRNVRSFTYSLHSSQADVFPRDLEFGPSGFRLRVASPWGEGQMNTSLVGSFNASNLLAALTAVMASEAEQPGFDFAEALAKISAVSPVKGRMEIIGDYPVSVVVDYAHTPEGLHSALKALREHFKGSVWCVFGCGGERDRGKRPLMAEIAEQFADRLVVTDDNPRQEDAELIIRQILRGLANRNDVIVEHDRGEAIQLAVSQAKEGDVILIAGKGHEEYQDVGGNRMVFSDVKQARVCLNRRFAEAD